MDACTLTAAVTAAANSLACRMDDDELAVMAAMFTQLGDTLALIAVQRGLCNARRQKDSSAISDILIRAMLSAARIFCALV